MKARLAGLCLLGSLPALGGCEIYRNAFHNIGNEFQLFHNTRALDRDLRCQAREMWEDYRRAHPEECFSAYFEDGFLDGFVDYLDQGGAGEPPAMPPVRYRKNRYMSPEGYAAVEDYFAGFRLGARIAIASGIRDTLVVPILVPAGNAAPAPVRQPDTRETLPPPRRVDPTAAPAMVSPVPEPAKS